MWPNQVGPGPAPGPPSPSGTMGMLGQTVNSFIFFTSQILDFSGFMCLGFRKNKVSRLRLLPALPPLEPIENLEPIYIVKLTDEKASASMTKAVQVNEVFI
jgi:hypothetical protein